MVSMLMWTYEGYFEQLFWMKPSFNIKFGEKPILAQNSLSSVQQLHPTISIGL